MVYTVYIYISLRLVDFYGKCGQIFDTWILLDRLGSIRLIGVDGLM